MAEQNMDFSGIDTLRTTMESGQNAASNRGGYGLNQD